jgi:hypothetical protein
MPITMTSPSNAYHLTLIFFFLSFLSFFFFKKKNFFEWRKAWIFRCYQHSFNRGRLPCSKLRWNLTYIGLNFTNSQNLKFLDIKFSFHIFILTFTCTPRNINTLATFHDTRKTYNQPLTKEQEGTFFFFYQCYKNNI